MRKPSGLKGFVGQPPVTLAILGAGAFCLYAWYNNSEAGFLGIGALLAMGWAMEANAKVAQYKAWKRAWDSMAPGDAPVRMGDRPVVRFVAFFGMVAGVAYFLNGHIDQPGYRFGLIWLAAGVGLLLLFGFIQLGRHAVHSSGSGRRPAARSEAVAICVRRPLIPVPDLKGAYDALPAHCWQVLNAGRSRD